VTAPTISRTTIGDHESSPHGRCCSTADKHGSGVLGDVQRLPNGNTLVTFSTGGEIVEVDAAWNTIQTLQSNFGYANWRETLYGPPAAR
jgi:hypothetical protein